MEVDFDEKDACYLTPVLGRVLEVIPKILELCYSETTQWGIETRMSDAFIHAITENTLRGIFLSIANTSKAPPYIMDQVQKSITDQLWSNIEVLENIPEQQQLLSYNVSVNILDCAIAEYKNIGYLYASYEIVLSLLALPHRTEGGYPFNKIERKIA